MAQTVKRLPAMRETQVRFLGQEDPLEKERAITPALLPGKIPWMEEPDRLQSHGVAKSRPRLSDFTSLSGLALRGFPCSPLVKESACSAGDPGSIPGLGRSPGEGNGNPFQCPCLENLTDRGAWWAAAHRVAKSQARLSD